MQPKSGVWEKLSFFLSTHHTQQYLTNCYKKLNIKDIEKKGFENCYPFIYYLEHGKNYYELCRVSPFSLQPVLLFYGMSQLLKACLLTTDPNYPESTSVLAHGATTRKRKKQSYRFLDDEVKVQKHGLFTLLADKMFHMKHLEGEKYTMKELLQSIPELQDLLLFSKHEKILYKLETPSHHTLRIPTSILDRFHMTEERFIRYIEETYKHLDIQHEKEKIDKKALFFSTPINKWNPLYSTPLTHHYYENTYYLPINREVSKLLPELLIHYLLLYNLSMISRYETDWWYDLLGNYASDDYPFIYQFLSVTAEKIPYYVYLYLMHHHIS